MAKKKANSKADSPAIVELELLERIKRLEKQQVLLVKEINVAVSRIVNACEKALAPRPTKKQKRTPEEIDTSYDKIRKINKRPPKDTIE